MTGVALVGQNGHQLDAARVLAAGAQLVGAYDAPPGPGRHYPSLEALLDDPAVTLVSICAPRRADQPALILRALAAGKHVLAEKPLAMSHAALDDVVRHAAAYQRHCYEMDSSGEAPYVAVRRLLAAGQIGAVVQIIARKAYPYADWRPDDPAVDGGLIMQAAIHAARWIVQTCDQTVVRVAAHGTTAGPRPGVLMSAAGIQAQLAGGGVASISASYLHRAESGDWADDELRVYGSAGVIVAAGRARTLRVITAAGLRYHDASACEPMLEQVLARIRGAVPAPSPRRQHHATRVVISAAESAARAGAWLAVPDEP
ncbi:MAG: Gfo/Idh/MocA family oxidoreductase [Chloroflexi bacterium]|jgi:predicted dehydrogenase|nr:Gfo/Idh/MocA family oxidoreductase [Chloroflexota bacterium]